MICISIDLLGPLISQVSVDKTEELGLSGTISKGCELSSLLQQVLDSWSITAFCQWHVLIRKPMYSRMFGDVADIIFQATKVRPVHMAERADAIAV